MEKCKKTFYFKAALIPSVVGFFLFFGEFPVQAATLYLFPSTGSYPVGQNFSVSIYVSSPDQAENAAQATINFPVNNLRVINLSKADSINTLWVAEPVYSNADGYISFAGVTVNPGFIGQSGKLLNVVFRGVSPGDAHISITKDSVLANDGQGTEILTGAGNADITIAPGENNPPATTGAPGAPAAPQISSPTHQDPARWYSNSNPKFTWLVPADSTAVRILYDKNANSRPTVVYKPPISEKDLTSIGDGIWYFHVQLRNQNGWGGISHFKFQIDTAPPEPFQIAFPDGKDTDNPAPRISFRTIDTLSGIDYYRVKVGDSDFTTVPAGVVEAGPYTLPLQTPGKKTIIVQSFDKAGNYTSASDEITIESIAPPTISDYSREIQEGDDFYVKGHTYADAAVRVYLGKSGGGEIEHQDVKSDGSGNFVLTWNKKLGADSYRFWATATDKRGAVSNPTDKYAVLVRPASWLQFVNYLTIIIAFFAIIASLLFTGWYLWHKMKRRLKKETSKAEKNIHEAFDVLREHIASNIRNLEKAKGDRPLTKEENKIISRARKDLDEAERLIAKEIEDIERQVK